MRKRKISGAPAQTQAARSLPRLRNEPANPPALSSQEDIQQELDKLANPKLRVPQAGDPTLSAGDIDAAWDRGDEGEETVGGSQPTPDQDIVEEVGKAAGVTYSENEPLRLGDKEVERDKQRWELNPASSEDYTERIDPKKSKRKSR
jgi:hypothetical protein